MQALFKLSKNFARSAERIFRIRNIRLLEEANVYILPQTAGR